MSEVVYGSDQKTRWFGTRDGDKFLCKEHAERRLPHLAVPTGGTWVMLGLAPRPTGQEECDDCKAAK